MSSTTPTKDPEAVRKFLIDLDLVLRAVLKDYALVTYLPVTPEDMAKYQDTEQPVFIKGADFIAAGELMFWGLKQLAGPAKKLLDEHGQATVVDRGQVKTMRFRDLDKPTQN